VNDPGPAAVTPASRWLLWLHRIEDGLLALMLLAMVLLASSQVVLRNLFDSGFSWGDPLLRLLVLWLGLMGAMVATRLDRHIAVDALLRILSPRLQRLTRSFTHLATAAVCAVLAWQAVRMVMLDYEYQEMILTHVPLWVADLILPIAFGVMTLRLLYQAVMLVRTPA
jgi:TRAP-type C4-dicarboxylate transport system permease small subunit